MATLGLIQKISLITFLVLFGTIAILTFNFQDSLTIIINDEDSYGEFNHPFMQTLTMFIAEFLCLFLFQLIKKTNKYKTEEQQASSIGKKRISIIKILYPACCDSVGALCIYISLNFLPPSINSILTCGIIITSALLSSKILSKKYSKNEKLGCLLVLIGILIVGLSGFLFPEDQKNSSDLTKELVAIFLMIISVLCYGVQYTIEEKYYSDYFLHQFELVGYEGMWGIIIYTIICSLLMIIKCPMSISDICIYYNGNYYFERIDYYFQQFFLKGSLQLAVILGIFSISIYNTLCQTVTKYLSCVTRAIVDVIKIMMIWIVALIVSFVSEKQEFHWENTKIGAIIIEAIGFSIVATGEIIYNFSEEKKINNSKIDYLINNDILEQDIQKDSNSLE